MLCFIFVEKECRQKFFYVRHSGFNSFHTISLSLPPENNGKAKVSYFFRGCRKRPVTCNGLKSFSG